MSEARMRDINMTSISIKTLITFLIGILILAFLIIFFLLGIQLSPSDAHRIFAQGCVMHCSDIQTQAIKEGKLIGIVAVMRAEELKGSTFMRACNFLHPDTIGRDYLCWAKGCCEFSLPPP